MTRVVAFGELLLRLKAPRSERLLQGPILEATFGGAEFNVLASLSRFGVGTEFVTVLPFNAIGAAAREEIRRYGIGTKLVRETDGRLGLYFLESAADRRPAQVVYDRGASAFAQLDPSMIDWDEALSGADWLHVSGITCAIGEGPVVALNRAVRAAARRGVAVSLDLNIRRELWRTSAYTPSELFPALLENVTVAFAGADEWSACLDGDGPPLAMDAEDRFRKFASCLLDRYPTVRTVVSGIRGTRSADDQTLFAFSLGRPEGLCRARSIRVRRVVDRIGAGDALVAGYLYGAICGWSSDRTLAFGLAAQALKHSIPGDVNRVSVAEVEALLAGQDPGRVLR